MPRIEPVPWRRAMLRAASAWLACVLPATAWAAAEASASSPEAQASSDGPRVRIVGVRGVSWQGHEARLDLILQVSNPGGWSLTLQDIRFRCSFNGTATAVGHSTGKLALPAHGQADVPVRVDIDGQALLAVLATLPPDGTVHYQLDGDAEIGDTLLRVPFHEQGLVVLR